MMTRNLEAERANFLLQTLNEAELCNRQLENIMVMCVVTNNWALTQ